MDLDRISELAETVGTIEGLQILHPLSDRHTLHVDGDYAAYYFAGNDDTPLGTARKNFVSFIGAGRTILGVPPENVTVHITDPMSDKGRRYLIAEVKDYQGQRKHEGRPKNWMGMRDFLHDGMPGSGYGVANWLDREADDGASLGSRLDFSQGRIPGILSRDKDFRMIPGRHLVWTTFDLVDLQPGQFNIVGPDGEVYGQKWFFLQMLQGDSADNIPGLEQLAYINSKGKPAQKQCGPTCAAEVLADADNAEEAFILTAKAYKDRYGPGWELRFAEQAMLLWLRNASNGIDDYMQVIPEKFRPKLQEANEFIYRRINK